MTTSMMRMQRIKRIVPRTITDHRAGDRTILMAVVPYAGAQQSDRP
jgi:hypothetical protein